MRVVVQGCGLEGVEGKGRVTANGYTVFQGGKMKMF